MPRSPYPLSWPDGWPRTERYKRDRSAFDIDRGFNAARDGALHCLHLMRGVSHVVITSNLPVNTRGLPYTTNQGNIDDPGIAVWWVQKGEERVIACDRWLSATENMRAIDKSLEALRGLDRWGATQIVERAFAGFAALPPGSGTEIIPDPPASTHWRDVLGLRDVDRLSKAHQLIIVRANYRELIARAHPDRGGTHEQAAALGAALAAAEKELT